MSFVKKVITTIKSDDKDYTAEVTLECHHGVKGKTYGDPYDCFPDEPPMVEIIGIEIIDVEDGGDTFLIGEKVHWDLTKKELNNLSDEAFGSYANDYDAAREAAYERKLDAMRDGD